MEFQRQLHQLTPVSAHIRARSPQVPEPERRVEGPHQLRWRLGRMGFQTARRVSEAVAVRQLYDSCTAAVLPAKYGPVRFEESKPMRGGEVAQPENFCMRKRKELELTERRGEPIIICTLSYGRRK